MTERPNSKSIRLDKWLKIARIFKRRTLAAEACEAGRVKVNGTTAKAGKAIKIGDAITVKVSTRYRELQVLDIVFKSIPAKQARELYQEERIHAIPDETLELIRLMKQPKPPRPPKYKGRPSKKERRDLERIKGR
jgi:ribosome-associated heat shock protein Hsp15